VGCTTQDLSNTTRGYSLTSYNMGSITHADETRPKEKLNKNETAFFMQRRTQDQF
jgi:hypothetical protein